MHVEIDPVLIALGPLGLFSVVQLMLYFLGYLSDAHQLFSYVFVGQNVGHRCAAPANMSELELAPLYAPDWLNSTEVTYGECAISVTRNDSGRITSQQFSCIYGMKYDSPRERSIVSEFDLVCERAGLSELTQTVLSMGTGLGAVLCPWLSDVFGRKKVLVISEGLIIICTIIAGFAPNYVVFAVSKFFIGFLQTGIGLTGVTAGVELFPTSMRAVTSGLVSTVWWVMCIASLSPIAYAFRLSPWRHLQIALAGSASFVIFMIFFMDEPIRWLVANGRDQEAEKVIKKAARMNKKNYHDILKIFHGLRFNLDNKSPVDHGGTEKKLPVNGSLAVSNSCITSDCVITNGQTKTTGLLLTPITNGTDVCSPPQKRSEEGERYHSKEEESCNAESESLYLNASGKVSAQDNGKFIDGSKQNTENGYCRKEQIQRSTHEDHSAVKFTSAGKMGDCDGDKTHHTVLASDTEEEAAVVEPLHVAVAPGVEKTLGFLDLWRHRILRKNITLCWFIWFVDALTYFGLYLTTGQMAMSLYIGFFLNAMVEGASGIFMTCMLNRLGRKMTIGIFQALAAIGMIVSGVCFSYYDNSQLKIVGTVASLFGRLGIGGAFNVMFMYLPEIFPTNVRNRALGTSVAVSTIGAMVAPYSNLLAKYALWGPGALFGTLNVVAVLCLLALPESLGKELPQTVRDLESWYDVTPKKSFLKKIRRKSSAV